MLLNLNDLLSKQLESEESKTLEIHVSRLGGELSFKTPDNEQILDALDKVTRDNSVRNIKEAYRNIIYHCCDTLHNDDLIKQYECVEPWDIVDKLFGLKDVMTIGERLLNESGLGDVEEEIKK